MMNGLLPKRHKGRQCAKAVIQYRQDVAAFCSRIIQINSTLDFKIGSRDWCYLLEKHGLRKGDFDAAQNLINDCRKSGDLPLDICAVDTTREAVGIEEIDDNDIADEVDSWVDYLLNHRHKNYTPISFWDDLNVYLEVAVEKLGLRNLFLPVCNEFRIPITNLKGWSDINARAAMMRRFAQHEADGRQCVLLAFTDHDPGGLHIADSVRKNLEDLSRAVGWSPTKLVISRFGLDADFIDANNLTWIDNLETSSGGELDDPEHHDHHKTYVQEYLAMMTARYGEALSARKCEANALIVVPDLGRLLCRNAILQYIPADAVQRYERELIGVRNQLRDAFREQVTQQ